MKSITTITQLREALAGERGKGKSIGFVPTMGFFHEGHLSLMRRAKDECDVVVISIFINPTQFAPDEDFASYPRDIERDKRQAEQAGVDFIFVPSVDEMYPEGYKTYVDLKGSMTEGLCAKGRPGHFKGVATVVTKFFNIIQPNKAYFGQKDAQQAVVIKQMVKDLNIPVEIVVCPIVREADGLALSSRNVYLSTDERRAATVLNFSLREAEEMISKGIKDASAIKDLIEQTIKNEPLASLEYVSLCDIVDLKEKQRIDTDVLIAVAAKFGEARLIDNTVISLKHALSEVEGSEV